MRTVPRVAGVMWLEAVSLAVMSSLHLAGLVHGRAKPFDSTDAGIAEAVIGLVLAGSAAWMWRHTRAVMALRVGLAANIFAVLGFAVGLSITASSGHIPDIAYHAAVLPIIVASVAVLWRSLVTAKTAA